jgi:hypothetical protein
MAEKMTPDWKYEGDNKPRMCSACYDDRDINLYYPNINEPLCATCIYNRFVKICKKIHEAGEAGEIYEITLEEYDILKETLGDYNTIILEARKIEI